MQQSKCVNSQLLTMLEKRMLKDAINLKPRNYKKQERLQWQLLQGYYHTAFGVVKPNKWGTINEV